MNSNWSDEINLLFIFFTSTFRDLFVSCIISLSLFLPDEADLMKPFNSDCVCWIHICSSDESEPLRLKISFQLHVPIHLCLYTIFLVQHSIQKGDTVEFGGRLRMLHVLLCMCIFYPTVCRLWHEHNDWQLSVNSNLSTLLLLVSGFHIVPQHRL